MMTYVYHKTRTAPCVRFLVFYNNYFHLIILIIILFSSKKIAQLIMEKLFALTLTEYKDYSTKLKV